MRRTQEEINSHNQKIMNFFNNDRKGPKNFCNRTLSSQGENFAIHDAVLASMSGYFDKLFSTEMKEKYNDKLELDSISPKRLKNVLDFIYTGDVELTNENVWETLEDADYTQTDDLRSFCNKFMLGNVTTNNCLKLRKYSARYGLNDVEKKTNKMIADNIAAVVQHDDFKELDVGDMSEVIGLRDKNCEEVVFTAIVKWVNFNLHQREELFVKFFSQLDLSLMTTHFLQQVSNERLVRQNLVCLQMFVDNCVFKAKKSSSSTEFLVIGGEGSETDCVIYNVDINEKKPDLNPGRSGLTSTRVGKKVYVMGGDGKKCKVFDLDENTWNKIPDMLEERQYCASACVGDYVYVTGGQKGLLKCCEKFHIPSRKWEKISDMLHSRRYHGTVVLNDMLYCIGGRVDGKNDHSCECYNVETNEWAEIAPLLEKRSGLVCVVLDKHIYAIGGDCCGSQPTVERYKHETNKWEIVAPLQTARNCPSACVVGNKIYVVGGLDTKGMNLKSVEVYDPATNAWNYCFDIEKPIYRGTIVTL